MSGIKARLDDMHKNLIPAISTIAEIDRHAQQHRRTSLHYLLDNHKEHRSKLAALLEKEEKQAKEALERVKTLQLAPEERRLLAEASLISQNYFNAAKSLLKKLIPESTMNCWIRKLKRHTASSAVWKQPSSNLPNSVSIRRVCIIRKATSPTSNSASGFHF